MTNKDKGLRFTLIRLTTYGIDVEGIEKALEKAGKEITKETGDWKMKMNSYLLKDNENKEEDNW